MTPELAAQVPEAIWQQVECGGYAADLLLYDELARATGGPVLDLGAGVGRTALHLAGIGHEVTALDRDASLLTTLGERAQHRGLTLETHVGDATDFDLVPATFGLILAPMQLLQLLGPAGRRAALARCAAHLRVGGRAAIAIVDGPLPRASAQPGGPLPDVLERDGWVYSSLPTGVRTEDGRISVERLRQAVSPAGELAESRSTDVLDVVTCAEIEAEAATAGLRPLDRAVLPDSDEHVGSTVIVLEAPYA